MTETTTPPVSDADLMTDLEELESAEDFLNYFGIAFDPSVVHVNRLHILQRFHDYIAATEVEAGATRYDQYAAHLARAYQDFERSDARTEKVFKVFQQNPQEVRVALTDLIGNRADAAEI